jgi:hypothetical protein
MSKSKDEQKQNDCDVVRFIRNLKSMVKASNAVCLISVDETLISKFIINNITYMADLVLKITSFKGKNWINNANMEYRFLRDEIWRV